MDQQALSAEWLLQPLIDAGADGEQIETLVVRLGFAVLVRDGSPSVTELRTVVADTPPAVQAAWTEVISRLIG